MDFKKVTVFIGPTGGGKSTLAKLAAVFQTFDFWGGTLKSRRKHFEDFSIENYFQSTTSFKWTNKQAIYLITSNLLQYESNKNGEILNEIPIQSPTANLIKRADGNHLTEEDLDDLKNRLSGQNYTEEQWGIIRQSVLEVLLGASHVENSLVTYFPSNRTFISAIEYSWPGLLRDDIGIPKDTLDFANDFSLARSEIISLNIPFLNIEYLHQNGQDFIKIPETEKLFRMYETASGIQSVTPLLVLLEHLSRQKEQSQSFIIEEPELNLYPTAQQGLLNWLVEKCTAGENDLTITTHSPYILSHLNLLLYAYQVAEKHPERADEVAKIVPRESWINPKEFSCYQVENGGVQSLVNEDLGLIDDNGLDNLSGDAADAFDNLIRLSKSVALK